MRRLLLASAATLLSQSAGADPLADLRACLDGLPGRDPIHASVTIEVRKPSKANGAGGKPTIETGSLTLEATAGPEGFALAVPPDLLASLREEQGRNGRNGSGGPITEALGEARFTALDDRLDAARSLRSDLEGATLLQESADTFEGTQARLVVVRPNPRLDEETRKHVKEMKLESRFWLDRRGCPLASESTVDAKFRLMIIKAEMHVRDRRTFARVGDRLVVTRGQEESRGSGLGQHEESTAIVTIVPHAAGPTAPPAPIVATPGATPPPPVTSQPAGPR